MVKSFGRCPCDAGHDTAESIPPLGRASRGNTEALLHCWAQAVRRYCFKVLSHELRRKDSPPPQAKQGTHARNSTNRPPLLLRLLKAGLPLAQSFPRGHSAALRRGDEGGTFPPSSSAMVNKICHGTKPYSCTLVHTRGKSAVAIPCCRGNCHSSEQCSSPTWLGCNKTDTHEASFLSRCQKQQKGLLFSCLVRLK